MWAMMLVGSINPEDVVVIRTLLLGFLGSLILFSWGFVGHVALGIYDPAFHHFEEELAVVAVLEDNARGAGVHYLPAEPLRDGSQAEAFVNLVPAGERVCDPAEVVEQRGFAPHLPTVGRLALAPDGTLWVQRYSVGEDDPGPIDLFDPDGRYLGTLSDDPPFPVGFLPDGRILFSEKDEWDVERLAVKTVEWVQEG